MIQFKEILAFGMMAGLISTKLDNNAHAGERRLIDRIDLGIAVDTKDGLIVPVLRNAGVRDAADLRRGLDRLRSDDGRRLTVRGMGPCQGRSPGNEAARFLAALKSDLEPAR